MTMTTEHRLTLKRLRQARRALVKASAAIDTIRIVYSISQEADDQLKMTDQDILFALEATDPDDKGTR